MTAIILRNRLQRSQTNLKVAEKEQIKSFFLGQKTADSWSTFKPTNLNPDLSLCRNVPDVGVLQQLVGVGTLVIILDLKKKEINLNIKLLKSQQIMEWIRVR
jgi:hypothetical protein